MADVSVKMGVSGLQQFKSGMQDAQASVKKLDAELKLNEKQLKLSGDAEKALQTQTVLLNEKLKAQKDIAKNAEAALKQMKDNGVKETSRSYQDMQRRLIEAQAAMLDTENQINSLGQTEIEPAGKTDQLADSLSGLNKKVSLEQVRSAIGSITTGLENAGKKAVEVGKQIWENITDSARWADDVATSASILNMDVEEYQKYKKVFDTVGDITVQEWAKMKQRVQNAIVNPSGDQNAIFDLLGISTHEMIEGKTGMVEGAAKEYEDLFWEIGRKLREKVANKELTQAEADVYAQALFGKGFAELNPLLKLGEEGFKQALADQDAVTEESIEKLATLNDKLIKLQADFNDIKAEVTAGLAPALQRGAEVLDNLLGKLLEYLQSEKGQKALEDMGKAVEGLFEDLGKIDPEQVVEGFSGVFNTIVEGVQWVANNWESVKNALIWIVEGWAALKIGGGILDIVKLVGGLGDLLAVRSAGAAAGAAWGGSFASAVMAAAPWLAGLIAMLTPAETGNNDLADASGNLTEEGWAAFLTDRERASKGDIQDNGWYSDIMAVSEYINEASKIWDDYAAVQAVARYAAGGHQDMDQLVADLIALGYTRRLTEEEVLPELNMPEEVKRVDSIAERGTVFKSRAPWNYGQIMDATDASGVPLGLVVEDAEDDILKQLEDLNVPAEIEPDVPEGTAEKIGEEIGPVPVGLVITDLEGDELAALFGENRHANGLWSVPFNGYPAILDKGERVVPAREVAASRNFSSNLYVESMYMNNGQDAQGLAAAMAAEQRRTMSGYGS